MLNLADYDMSADRGFLCRHNADEVHLTGKLAVIRDVAMTLPQLLPTGRVRHLLRTRLPLVDLPLTEMSDAEARACMVHYSFMVQAYVWGEPEAPTRLPANLAVPMVALADLEGFLPARGLRGVEPLLRAQRGVRHLPSDRVRFLLPVPILLESGARLGARRARDRAKPQFLPPLPADHQRRHAFHRCLRDLVRAFCSKNRTAWCRCD